MPIAWYEGLPRPGLRFTFPKVLTHQAAQTAVTTWRNAFANKPQLQEISLVWDCSAMIEYDGRAFTLWVATIREFRDRIHDIWIISGSSLVRTGATLIGLLTGLKVHSVESETDLLASVTQTGSVSDDS